MSNDASDDRRNDPYAEAEALAEEAWRLAAKAVAEVIPALKGKFDGLAVRVPTIDVSLVDLSVQTEKAVTVESINAAMKAAAEGPLKGILGYEDRPLVSADYVNDPRSGIVDGPATLVVDGTQVKVLAWYDNEWGYVNRMMELTAKVAALM